MEPKQFSQIGQSLMHARVAKMHSICDISSAQTLNSIRKHKKTTSSENVNKKSVFKEIMHHQAALHID